MGIFGKLKAVFTDGGSLSENECRSGSFVFLGPPSGEVEVLEQVLIEGLQDDPGLESAYLSRVQYDGEPDKVRVALCIDSSTSPSEVIEPLAQHCAEWISSIDILFFSDMGEEDIEGLLRVCSPFYSRT